jgi:hypothetical protein
VSFPKIISEHSDDAIVKIGVAMMIPPDPWKPAAAAHPCPMPDACGSGRFALIRDLFVFDDLPLIQTAETGPLDCRDMDKHIFSAPTLRLNKSVAVVSENSIRLGSGPDRIRT